MTRRARASASSPRPTSPARPAPSRTRARRAPWTSTTSGSPRTRSPARRTPRPPRRRSTRPLRRPATRTTRAVKVNLSAVDTGTNAAGVEKTEYRITTNGTAGNWTTLNNTAGDLAVRELGDGLQQRHAPRRVPLDGQGGQHGGDEVGHLQGPAAGLRSLGRVRRHGHPAALDPSHAQRRHAHHGPARADGLRRPAAPADERPRDRRRRRRRPRSARSTSSARTCPRWATPGPRRRSSPSATPAAGRTWAWWSGTGTTTSSAPRITHNLAQLGDLRRVLQGRPEHDRRCAHRRLEREHPADQHRSGDDQDALHACRRRQHGHRAVPDRRPGLRGDAGLGQLPEHHGRPGPQPEQRRPS